MAKSDINEDKLMGGKRKNGHKMDCECHICMNMKNKAKRGGYQEEEEKANEYKMGCSKKKNGHRANCKCPICKNMSNAKKGGKGWKKGGSEEEDKEESESDEEKDEESESESDEEKEEESESDEEKEEVKKSSRKGNGHKPDCKCPICKNMRKSKKGSDDETIDENQYIAGGTRRRRTRGKCRGGRKTRKVKRSRRSLRRH
jgi:hypothetical protein